MFIGYYSLANGITLFGLISSITACFLAAVGNHVFALYMLFLAFVCDMFDGRVARKKLNRSEAAKFYGVQLDSLCDLVSFGVTPCVLAFFRGFNGAFDVIIYCFFVVCGAIRLAYFNTLTTMFPKKAKDGYRGVPIPASVFAITCLSLLNEILPDVLMPWISKLVFIVMAFGFVLNIKFKKSSIKTGLILIGVEIIMLLIILILHWVETAKTDDNNADTADNSQTSEQSSSLSDDSNDDLYDTSSDPSADMSDTSNTSDTGNTSGAGNTSDTSNTSADASV